VVQDGYIDMGTDMGRKVGDEGAVDRRTDEHAKNKMTGIPKAQQRENKGTKSPMSICRTD